MISHVGQLPRLSQSEWIWNRVILSRQQSPADAKFLPPKQKSKDFELQDRFLHIAMKKSLDDGSSNVVAERNIAKGIFQPDFERHQPSFCRHFLYCFQSSCWRFDLCSDKWPAPAFAPAWLEKMPNDFSCRSAAKAESK